jgi:hypothetical protein
MDLVRVDDLFTLEALRTYVERLSPSGVFSYVMYTTRSDLVRALAEPEAPLSQPYIPALRTLTGIRQVLAESGRPVRFADHVLIAALPRVIDERYDLVHIVASKTPFAASERLRFLDLCQELEFEVLYPHEGADRKPHDPYVGVIESEDLARYADALPFSIWPATDDRPFQYALDGRHLKRALERGALLDLLAGNPLVPLGTSIGLVALLVTLLPLAMVRARVGVGLTALRRGGDLLVYFAFIGFGYMAVEIPVLLRLQSYLGKPIYGLSVGLFSFLLASGLGSQLTASFHPQRLTRFACGAAALVVALGFGFFWVSGPLFASTIAYPLAGRVLIAVAAIFPLAFPMGMLFPIGVKLLDRQNGNLIPWAWATNGCMSVLGIFGTRITALFLGFSHALLVGLAAYGLVAVFVTARARVMHRAAEPGSG